jgi:hypothetical protein
MFTTCAKCSTFLPQPKYNTMTLEKITEIRDIAENLQDNLEFDSICEIIAEFQNQNEWPIADWKVEDEAEDIVSAEIIIRVCLEGKGDRSATNEEMNAEIAKIKAAALEFGCELVEANDINRANGGLQVNLKVA